MKINIGGYDVEISAKKDYKTRSSKRDTLAFLNYLSLIFDDAGEFQGAQNGNPYAKESKQISRELYELCKDHGLYN